ncbi:hypothetical protein [Chryseobacterium limigenitum]|uniref:CarboxypepD_reg-like domain-containing protein n=1 Tax=Chryseobacterium limigenitum TaxID=1612149 RepID=A0A1K2ILX9_9FLAO|nr:hypothetical protein [Chryseobacterium limigenitum]SFZ93460.1 hypothetical protein SAMN05216324_10586 [Chryseobacterium limigenitum]
MKNKYLIFFCFIFLCIAKTVYAQSFVNGTVLSEDGFSISNVLVYNIANQKKTYTDSEGKFNIEGNISEELRFIKDGYERKSEKIGNSFALKVLLIKMPFEIEEVRLNNLSGNLLTDSKRMKIDNSKEKLEKDIGLPKLKGVQRERVPTVSNDVIVPLLFGSIKVDALYKLISGDARRMKSLYKYQDLQEKVKWIRERIENDYFVRYKIPEEKIGEFLEFAIQTNPNILSSIKSNKIETVRFELNNSIDLYSSRLNKK